VYLPSRNKNDAVIMDQIGLVGSVLLKQVVLCLNESCV